MNDEYLMRPGDRFVARECGCAITVDTGPVDVNEVKQSPKCCCGHDMVKEGNADRLTVDSSALSEPAFGQLAAA